MRFRAAGWDVRFCPDAEAVHVRNASWSPASVRFVVEKERSRLHLYRKHFGRIGAAYFMALAFLHHALRAAARSVLYAVQPSNRRSLHKKIAEHLACLRWMLSA
jgi:GT2 family glycosyltransferase